MKQLLHTPEGVRDIYNGECGKKLALEDRLHETLMHYGYTDIQTPTFEYFDVFRKEIGTIPSKELYKFFDREGETLVLRPDFTPAIARVAATIFADEKMPIRLCYTGNTFINHTSYQGRLKENTQMGAELIGDDSAAADAEMIALVAACLLKAGLSDFQLSVSNVDFLKSLIEDAGLDEDQEKELKELIKNQNFFGINELLEGLAVSRSAKASFKQLDELVGGYEILEKARDVAPSTKGILAIKRLEKIYDILCYYGMEKYVTFDLSLSSGAYNYYTGVVFRGYTFGSGDAIVKGGRYDTLIEKFGKEAPSIGFAIVVDELQSALSRQHITPVLQPEKTLVLYAGGREEEGIRLASELREKGERVVLMKKEMSKSLEDYQEYGRRSEICQLYYIAHDRDVTEYSLS
ncbi:ATP phosphoribosyltransferase regulatory subunit [Lachnospiraceae bacterium PFB1-21]